MTDPTRAGKAIGLDGVSNPGTDPRHKCSECRWFVGGYCAQLLRERGGEQAACLYGKKRS